LCVLIDLNVFSLVRDKTVTSNKSLEESKELGLELQISCTSIVTG